MITTGAISISEALTVNQTLLELRMVDNQIGDDGIIAIAGSFSISSITVLDVRWCGISVVGARLIMKSAVNNCNAVYKFVKIEHYDDDEVKRMESALNSRKKQDVRLLF